MRKSHRINSRIIALFMAVVMFLTSFRSLAFVLPVAAATDGITIRDDAMHFYFRHWHTDIDYDSMLNPSEGQGKEQEDYADYFVIVEGYIMPDGNGGYVCYIVNQGAEGYDELVPIDKVEESPYIGKFDPEEGSLELYTKLLIDSNPDIDDPVERFAGISISAGHGAVTDSDEDSITIKYDKNIHLVKGHVFYQNKSKIVTGTYDTDAFDNTGMFSDDQIDTAWVLTYKAGVTNHNEGELVKSKADSAQVCTDLNDLPDGTKKDNVEWTKYFSTAPGLHTDKTVVQTEDGRAFLYDLEAWYTEGYAAQVGLVLDASGSMAFALDKPSVINVKDLKLGDLFKDKIGFVEKNNAYKKSSDDLIGYYQFQKNGKNDSNTGDYRTWYLNSAKDPYTNYNVTADFSDISKKNNFAHTVKQANRTSGNIDFSNSNAVWLPSDFNSVFSKTQSGWGDPISFSSSKGFWLTDNASKSGFLLEVKPDKSDNFTISFSLLQDTADACQGTIEILYIGPTTVTGNDQKYFRVYRTGDNIVAEYDSEEVVKIENVFARTAGVTHTISFAFGENGMTAYLDGKVYGEPAQIDGLNAEVIVFDPFEDEYNKKTEKYQYFSVNNVYLFNAALDADEVDALVSVAGKEYTDSVQKSASAFLNEAELAFILNTRNVDNSLLGFADYSYFVYNPASGTEAYSPITYYTNTDADLPYANKNNVNGKGWYYISCSSSITTGTSKQLYGLLGGAAFTDTILTTTVEAGKGTAPDVKEENIKNSGVEYEQSGSGPIKFYIDSEGNLRCFFAAGTNTTSVYTSFVYELADEDYIRTEGLQRVLGSFANTLNDRSPSAQLSAVQFSKNDANTDGKLLLNWTNDSERMTGFLSLNKGGGTASGKNKYDEYNYTMTGGTYTDKGLAAFRTLLADKDYKHDENEDNDVAPRYLILFTDGEYNCTDQQLKDEADILKGIKKSNDSKEYDYTIFVVLLTDSEGETDKTKTLASISGKKGVTVTDADTGLGSDGKRYYFHISDLDELAHAFMTDILDHIVDDMNGYTVEDYIDPRFDLMGSNGDTWHLHANGEVMIQPAGVELEDAKADEKNYYNIDDSEGKEFHLSGETTPDARNPKLYYDKDEDMYYLKWENQTIPTCGVGSDRLEVWVAQVEVIAKEDFIGGNDILVGGNAAEMNWVYNPNDGDRSSGIDDTEKKIGDQYPSKGFPRVVVNVQLWPLDTLPLNDVIFKGEYISHAQILTDIEDKYVTDTYYLEYLRRYAYQRYLYVWESKKEEENKASKNIAKIAMLAAEAEELEEDLNKPLIELLNDWLGIKDDDKLEKAFSVPYMYLPSVEHNDDGTIKLNPDGYANILTNAGGKDTHQRDVIGILTYRWHQIEPGDEGDEIRDYVKVDTEQNKYSLTVEFTPLKKGDTLKDVHYLTSDGTSYYHNTTDGADEWYTYENGEKKDIEEPDQETLNDCTVYQPLRSYIDVDGRDHIFAHYLPIDADENGNLPGFTGDNDDFEGLGFNFDRAEAYVNGSLITDEYFKWNSDYKPARNEEPYHAGDLQPAQDQDDPDKYGTSSKFINKGRTLESQSSYTQEIVSGGFVLELKMLIGELAEWLEIGNDSATIEQRIAAIQNVDNNTRFKRTFTLTATRSFTETDVVQSVQVGKTFEDYDDTFTFTFELEYTGEQLKKLVQDDYGYVTLLAKTTKIECDIVNKTVEKADNGQIQTTTVKTGETAEMDELPIGTYEFKLDAANKNDDLGDKLHFAEITHEEDANKFADAYEYFNELVLNGLNTTNENPKQIWKEIKNADGTTTTLSGHEILKNNITDYIADAKNAQDKRTVTFYIGTALNTDHRGNTESADGKLYTDDRLGIIRLSTGMTMLTIKEKGADSSDESFIYHIKGTTLGGKEVDLTVSVQGNSSTTIEIAPGNYTVEEIHDWSWRYNNKVTTGVEVDWIITEDWITASNTLRYQDDDPVKEHKTVVYEHERNDKVWLGGENHEDNLFGPMN